jgi:hypothetical protein
MSSLKELRQKQRASAPSAGNRNRAVRIKEFTEVEG